MTFKEQALQALYKIQDQVKGAHASTVGDCIRAVKRIPNMENTLLSCTGENCPMRIPERLGKKIKKCTAHNCKYRTPQMTRADCIRAMSDEELVTLAVRQIGGGYDWIPCGAVCNGKCEAASSDKCRARILKWLQQSAGEQ